MAPTLDNEKLQPGDLIEISRRAYSHWAMYAGDGYVIHLAPPSEKAGEGMGKLMSVVYDKAWVKRERFWDVVGTDTWKVNNLLDDKYDPLPVYQILKEARAQVGQEQTYCVARRNCEHFVTDLRYGEAESRQVRRTVETVVGIGMATVFVLGAVGLASVLFGDGNKERRNTSKK